GLADQLLPHDPAILEQLRQVAWRLLQDVEEAFLEVLAEMAGKLDGAGGVAETLGRLQAADLVEEPAAARVHEQPVPLHFQQPEAALDAGHLDARVGVLLQKRLTDSSLRSRMTSM